MMSESEIKKIFGENYIGFDELKQISSYIPIGVELYKDFEIPSIPYSETILRQSAHTHLLILALGSDRNGKAVSIETFRSFYGIDPNKSEPCFYNQDWYLKEPFYERAIETRWILIQKETDPDTKGKEISQLKSYPYKLLPTAVMYTYIFFIYYFHSKDRSILWENDYAWCFDTDSSGDRIYVGRYKDIYGLAKNGFSIHRHLSIKANYGANFLR